MKFGFLLMLQMVIAICCVDGLVSAPNAHAQEPPQYELTWIDNIWNPAESLRLNDINEQGVVVGSANIGNNSTIAFMYDEFNGQQDLNNLGGIWFDLDGQGNSTITSDWIAIRAKGINEQGQIVGTAEHVSGREFLPRRAFVLSFPQTSLPEYSLLPNVGNTENYGKAINDDGVVVADAAGNLIVFDPLATPTYSHTVITTPEGASAQEINNSGVIVTRVSFTGGHVVTPAGIYPDGSYDYSGEVADYFLGDEFYGINDSGMISGLRNPVTSGKPSQRRDGGALRFQYPGVPTPADLLIIDNGSVDAFFNDVNEFGDVTFAFDGPAYIALDRDQDPPEIFNLDDLIQFDTLQDESYWLTFGIQPNGINDLGQIIVRVTSSPKRIALLTPIVAGPTLSVDDLEIDEGGNGTTTEGQFTVALSELTGEDVTVPYTIHDGTATTGVDYTTIASSGLLTFAFSADETSKTVEFTIVGDDMSEPDETFTIVLGEAIGGASVTSGTGTATIKNDDGGSAMYSSNDTPKNIRDRKNTFSTISIGDDYSIVGMTVNLDISHNRTSDLSATLIGPDGREAPLSNFNGNNDVVLFNDTRSIGNWTLKVRDNERGETGTLNAWSITVDY